MATVGPVIARVRAGVSRETVWTYFADPQLRAAWWPDAELDVVLGGAVSERWSEGSGAELTARDAAGTIDVLIAGHALGFRWRDGADEHETAVLITLRSHDRVTAGATVSETDIMVTETGFGRFADAFERTADAQQSWIELLEALRAALPVTEPVVLEGVAGEGAGEPAWEPETDAEAGPGGGDDTDDPVTSDAAEGEALEVEPEPDPDPDPDPDPVDAAEPEADSEVSGTEAEDSAPGDSEPDAAEPDAAEADAAGTDAGEADTAEAAESEVAVAAGAEAAETAEQESAETAESVLVEPAETDASDGLDETMPDFDSILRGDAQPRPE